MKKRLKKTGKKRSETSDFGTPELRRQHQIVMEPAGLNVGSVRLRVTDSCELDRLLNSQLITDGQHSAGTRLGWDFDRAGGRRSCLATLASSIGGGETGGRFVYAIGRVTSAMRQLQIDIGRKAGRLVILVVGDETKITNRAQLTCLTAGLDSLSKFYSSRTSVPVSLR